MASQQQVKQYLAYWFQLGKKVINSNGKQELPDPVLQGERYSQAFEDCWQLIIANKPEQWYLEGTAQTIAQLLTPSWEVTSCARCQMPIPIATAGVSSGACPCDDLPNWPNTQIPAPRSPVNNQVQLKQIRDRIKQLSQGL